MRHPNGQMGPVSNEGFDRGVPMGCHHPVSTLALLDPVRLETVLAVSENLYDQLRKSLLERPAAAAAMAETRLLDCKNEGAVLRIRTGGV